MQDLVVLSAEKNYSEFFSHALDVKPANRNKQWKSMVESMGQNYLTETLNLTQIDSSMFKTVRTLSDWPIFKNNEFFIKKRDQVFIREINTCIPSTKQNCLELAKNLYHDYNHDDTFDYEFVKAISPFGYSATHSWKYVKNFVKKDISEFYCNKSPLKEIIQEQIFSTVATDKTYLKNFHQDCLKVLSDDLRAELINKDSKVSRASYLTLESAGKLSTQDKQLYDLVHFINDEVLDDELLNNSLKTIKSLGKDYNTREKLIGQYQKIDPLPDEIFSLNKKSNISRAKILSRYFPEIIDKYAHTCLDYLQGTRTFPNGNPTHNCHQFFELSKKHHLVPDSFARQYDEATYFLKKKPL